MVHPSEDKVDLAVSAVAIHSATDHTSVVPENLEMSAEGTGCSDHTHKEFKSNTLSPTNVTIVQVPAQFEAPGMPHVVNSDSNSKARTGISEGLEVKDQLSREDWDGRQGKPQQCALPVIWGTMGVVLGVKGVSSKMGSIALRLVRYAQPAGQMKVAWISLLWSFWTSIRVCVHLASHLARILTYLAHLVSVRVTVCSVRSQSRLMKVGFAEKGMSLDSSQEI